MSGSLQPLVVSPWLAALATRDPEEAVARLVEAQFGAVSRAQLLALGVSADAIDRRVRRRTLRRIHPRVYAIGHLGFLGRAVAALLWAGPGALLSHRTAAILWSLFPEDGGPIHVTCGRGRRAPQGLVVHGVRAIPRHQLRNGLPVTTAARTLLDIPSRRLLGQALYDKRTSIPHLRRELQASPSHPNARTLRRLIETAGATRSELEDQFLALVNGAGLPRPETNVRVAGYEVDCLWRARRVVVELDGWAAHGHRQAFEQDARKTTRLQREGWMVLRFTSRQVTEEPLHVIATLTAALYSADSSHQ